MVVIDDNVLDIQNILQTYNKNMQVSHTPKLNPTSHTLDNKQSCTGLEDQSSEAKIYRIRQAELKEMNIDDYCLFLKDQRVKYKPPILDQSMKQQFCAYFDGIWVKKSLEEVTKYIKTQRKRKLSDQKSELTHDQQLTQTTQAEQNENRNSQKVQTDLGKSAPNSQQLVVDKVLLYSWQLCNIRTIIGSESGSIWAIPAQVINNIHRLCISTSRIYVSKWGLRHVTMQAMQICYFNLLKNRVFDVDPVKNGSLCCLIQAILADTLGNEHQQFVNLDREFQHMAVQEDQNPIRKNSSEVLEGTNKKKQQIQPKQAKPKISKKTSTELELQWFTYIIEYCVSHCQVFIRQTYTHLSNSKIHSPTVSGVSFLHYISVLLNKIINDRTTTEIVKGYICPIEDVRQMYNRANGPDGIGAVLQIKISWVDYEWLLQVLLPVMWKKYKGQINRIWQRQICNKQAGDHKQYNGHFIYCIMNILSVINCCNFLGGYIPQLQKKTTKLVMEFGLEFLELSYLIYELCHAKKKNIQLKTYETMQENFITNLSAILNSETNQVKSLQKNTNFSIELIEVVEPKIKVNKSLSDVLPLEEGQLVSIIRMLSNLVHINEVAQKYFEDNIKYFRIIMSLTHEFEPQLTMKNWAIVFLRNVSQRSSILRGELEKLQIDVKVDNGTSPFI